MDAAHTDRRRSRRLLVLPFSGQSHLTQERPFHRAHLRAWRTVVLATQTPPRRVLPGPHAAAIWVMMLSGSRTGATGIACAEVVMVKAKATKAINLIICSSWSPLSHPPHPHRFLLIGHERKLSGSHPAKAFGAVELNQTVVYSDVSVGRCWAHRKRPPAEAPHHRRLSFRDGLLSLIQSLFRGARW
jgi:hypothetical protein